LLNAAAELWFWFCARCGSSLPRGRTRGCGTRWRRGMPPSSCAALRASRSSGATERAGLHYLSALLTCASSCCGAAGALRKRNGRSAEACGLRPSCLRLSSLSSTLQQDFRPLRLIHLRAADAPLLLPVLPAARAFRRVRSGVTTRIRYGRSHNPFALPAQHLRTNSSTRLSCYLCLEEAPEDKGGGAASFTATCLYCTTTSLCFCYLGACSLTGRRALLLSWLARHVRVCGQAACCRPA